MTFCPQSEYVSELPAEVRSSWCATRAHNNDAQHLNFASIYFSILAVSPRGGYRADGQSSHNGEVTKCPSGGH